MPSTQTDNLFRLIKTMTKAEKRGFKLYANRIGGDDQALFIQLFDVLDKQPEYDEEGIFNRVPAMKRSQLSNLKRHLYQQILTSLRLLHAQKYPDIEIREHIDFARILYGKGLYNQSLKALDRAKAQAKEIHQDILHLEIFEFEKLIETRHVTRAMPDRAETLAEEAERRGQIVSNVTRLSNLAMQLYSYYIKIGHVRTEKDALMLASLYKKNLPILNVERLTFYERVYYYQANVWYYYIQQNFPQHYRYCQKWVDIFEEFPLMKKQDKELYMRGLHDLLTAHFYTNSHERLVTGLHQLENFIESERETFNMNEEVQAYTYLYTAKINLHYLEGAFTEGVPVLPEITYFLEKYGDYLDDHRILIFYYKIACLYFGSGDNGRAIDFLNQIINYKAGSIHSDIQCYARILHLIAHFELKHYNLLEYLVKSVYRFLAKMEDLNAVQMEILRFLRKELYTDPTSMKIAFATLLQKLEKLRKDPHQRRSFLYLDIASWLESKMSEKTVQEVIREKFEGRKRKVF